MNNQPSTERDPLVADALKHAPEAPEHGSDFWAKLDASLEAESPGSAKNSGIYRLDAQSKGEFQFRVLASAAALLVVGLVGVAIFNSQGGTTSLEVTDEPPTTVEVTPTTEPVQETTMVEPATTITNPDVNVPLFGDRAESELFLYDVPVPPGFSLDYATGRGVSQSLISDGFDGSIEVLNYNRLDPNWVDQVIQSNSGELIEQKTVRVPLYDRTDSGLVDKGVFLEVEQFTYQLEDSVRVERGYNFNDRVINASVTLNNDVAADYSAEEILDDIQMYNAAFVPISQCSTLGDTVPETPATLNPAQAARFEGIVQALVTCDWEALEAQLDPNGFTATFGGNEAIELWQGAENYDEPILETLLDHMRTKPGFADDGAAAWPRPQQLFWEDVTDDMKQELLELGYTEGDLEIYSEIGYIGYRTGMDSEGNWQYFVAGD